MNQIRYLQPTAFGPEDETTNEDRLASGVNATATDGEMYQDAEEERLLIYRGQWWVGQERKEPIYLDQDGMHLPFKGNSRKRAPLLPMETGRDPIRHQEEA